MSHGGGADTVTIALGFLVVMLVLVDIHGFSAASAIFAIPAVIMAGLLIFISHLLGLLTGFFIGAVAAGPLALLILAAGLALVSRSLVGFTAQNYMLFAVFMVLALLVA